MFPLPLHIYFEIAALFTSVLFWRSHANTWLRWFFPFLLFIVTVELTARYLTHELKQPNAWIFGLSIPFEYLFYSLIFYGLYQQRFLKKATLLFMLLFFAYCGYSAIFVTGLRIFDMNILVIANLAMLVMSMFFFFELYASTDNIPLFRNPWFWIVSGIFLFNAGELSYNMLSMLVIDEGFDSTLKIFRQINNNLILVLYSCYIIGFVCQKTLGTYTKD